jgi:membrane fusion protein, peptide pheromone/bacteriocin exporter
MKQYFLNELTDSRLLYDKKPPKILFYTISIVLLFTFVMVMASLFLHKPYVVKASGIVTSNEKTALTVNATGTITYFNISEGQMIHIGDVIMTFDDSQTQIQIEQYADMISYCNDQIVLYTRCVNEINEGTNTFSKEDTEEAVFYYIIKQYQNKVLIYTRSDEELKDLGYYTKKDIKKQQLSLSLQREDCRYQVISDLTAKRQNIEKELLSYTAQYNSYKRLLDSYIQKATQNGVVHLTADIQSGMFMTSGSVIGSISSNSQEDITIESYISAQDRSRISLGAKVEIEVLGMPKNDYGVLTGFITEIDNDMTTNQNEGTVFYKVKIVLDQKMMANHSGKTIMLVLGMLTQCNIKCEDSTWFAWAMEQIGIELVP